MTNPRYRPESAPSEKQPHTTPPHPTPVAVAVPVPVPVPVPVTVSVYITVFLTPIFVNNMERQES